MNTDSVKLASIHGMCVFFGIDPTHWNTSQVRRFVGLEQSMVRVVIILPVVASAQRIRSLYRWQLSELRNTRNYPQKAQNMSNHAHQLIGRQKVR